MSTHYVAQLKVEKVTKTTNQDRASSSHGAEKRDVTETINLTFKASSIEGLKNKMANHVALMDEDDLL
jgi:hypothetical protein